MSERLFALVLLLRCNPIDGVRFCAANDKCVCNSMGPEFLTIRSVAADTSGGKMSARRLEATTLRRETHAQSDDKASRNPSSQSLSKGVYRVTY